MSRLLTAILVFFSLGAGTAQAQSLTASPSNLYASQSITATWSAIAAPTSTDWIGLYAVGAADSTVIAWQYTNGSASGSLPIQVPNTTSPGAYELRIFSNNSYTRLATSNGVTVDPPPPANLSASPSSLYASQSVTATWSSILAPTTTDWIGLYAVGAADSAVIAWQYASGSASGSVPIQVPNTTVAGAYELRLFANNSYTKLATSNGITVQPPPPANLTAAPANLYASQSVTATWSSILAPTANDWIGLYAVGATDSAVIAWQYTSGSASGSVPIQVPNTTVAGAYELRLFANNSYTKLATSNGFTVDPPPPATLSATGSASPGGSVTANWAGILAPTANDWIGLYVPGAADSAVLSWHYTTGVAAGNVPVSLPANLAQGSYELRLFANNSYTKLATSATFGVGVKTLSFIHVDHLNTPRLIADDVGTAVWKWDQQEPFGNDTPNQDPGATGATFDFPLRFPGQYFDRETNLAYNYSRDYDPAIGGYKESDLIGLRGGLNTYLYVYGDPISYTDPLGLDATIWNNTVGGRSRWIGPTNGNWGGRCWGGGRYSCGPDGSGNLPPTDSADACYMRHDKCWDECRGNVKCKAICDAKALDELKNLPKDPRTWPQPPRAGTEGDTLRYRDQAIDLFSPPPPPQPWIFTR